MREIISVTSGLDWVCIKSLAKGIASVCLRCLRRNNSGCNGSKAKKVLESSGISCYEEFVLHTTLPNVPGALSQLAKKLAAKDINIGACYQTTVKGEKKASAVLAVSHLQRAATVSTR